MAFKKGNKQSTGRPKGAANKITVEIRDKLKEVIEGEMGNVKITLDNIKKDNPAQYLTLLEKFMGYVVPKKKDITSDDKSIVPNVTITERRDTTEPEAD